MVHNLDSDLLFDVRKVPVGDILAPGFEKVKKNVSFAIIKDFGSKKDPEILSFVSPKYELITNREILESFQEMFIEKGLRTEMNYQAFNDVRFRISFTLMDFNEPIQPGDLVAPEFYVTNSYNGSQRYQFGLRVKRLVCSNGLTMWVNENKVRMLHTPGAGEGVAIEKSFKAIEEFLPAFEETLDPYYELAERKLTGNEMRERIQEVAEETSFPVTLTDDALLQVMEDVKNLNAEPSDWLVYNALNYQLNHNTPNLLGRKADRIDHEVLDYLMNY